MTTPAPTRPALLRVPDAAIALSTTRATLYRLIRQGKIRTVTLGAQIRVPASEIDRLAGDNLDQFGA